MSAKEHFMPPATSGVRSSLVKGATVQQLFSQSRIGSAGAIIGSAVLVWTLWTHVEHWLLVVWFSGLIVLQALRLALNKAYHRRPLTDDPDFPWEGLVTGAIILSGLWWGIVSVALFPPHSLIAQFILAICIAGVACVDKEWLLAALGKIRKGSSNSTMSVLVVDDEPLVLENLSAILTISGFRVFKASNGRSGILQALHCRPDVIILDLLMPDINGFEVIEQLRKTPDTRNIPIIVYTAKDLSEDDRSQLTSHVQAIALKSHGGQGLLQHLNLLRTGSP